MSKATAPAERKKQAALPAARPAKNTDHKRVNDILLGPLERPALAWLAAHMPAWVTPDILTGIGMLGTLTVFAGYALTNVDERFMWLACLGFVINWFGDSLDGSLARFRHIERPKYGFFIDHTVDALSQIFIFFGLGLSPYVRFDVAAVALCCYMLLSVLVYVRTFVTGVFKISYAKLGPTELRVIIIIVNLVILYVGNPRYTFTFGVFSVYDFIGMGIAVILFVMYVVSMLHQAGVVNRMEQAEKAARQG